ncbi:MAG: CBS domain-containing protein [Alphaproteobacteria bacterium]|nr:CBS domain-containing protein [Alphaproteobacteria bacterium]
MKVAEVMTTPVISVEPSTGIAEAARLMIAHRISGLPVVARDGVLVGMVSEGDFLRRGELGTERKRSSWLELLVGTGRSAGDYVQSHGRKIGEVMTQDVVTTSRDTPLEEVVEIMSRRRIKRLPVLEGGKLVGIVTRSDLLRALTRVLPAAATAPTDDERIHDAIVAELGRHSWAGRGLIRVHVAGGAVELTGAIFDERARLAARVVAENVPGVISVSDQLVWVEPMSGMAILPSGPDEK